MRNSLATELGDPALVKKDVEGAKLDVLRRALATIRRAPPALVVEFANSENVELARRMLRDYQFEQLSDLDWLLSSSVLRDLSKS